ncbi:MAG: PLP-dependent transferase [Chitinophagaceae bacterium]|nr:PLP-dependent transferase [Chitinophagaceae bacterium]
MESGHKVNTTFLYLESLALGRDFAIGYPRHCALKQIKGITSTIDITVITPIYQLISRYCDGGRDSHQIYRRTRSHPRWCSQRITCHHGKIFNSEYLNIGGGIQPFNAWLMIRGLRTLPGCVWQESPDTPAKVNGVLSNHPAVERVKSSL